MNYLEYFRKTLQFHLTPRSTPDFPGGFSTPVVVVGSAPTASMPVGFNASYRVISINGSQVVSHAWGRSKPDVTILTGKQIRGENTNAVSVRNVLNGKATGLLLMFWNGTADEATAGLRRLDYRYDDFRILTKRERMAMHYTSLGTLNRELSRDERFSNGITGVLYALANKAPAVIISGINPASSGHIYNEANLKRQHADTDSLVLQSLIKRGAPIYTADPEVAQTLSIPLWASSQGNPTPAPRITLDKSIASP